MPRRKDEEHEDVQDNPPAGEAFRTMEDDGKRYRIVGTMVGAHRRGTIVSAKELGPGAEIQRLLDVGAISVATEDEILAAEESPEYRDMPLTDVRLPAALKDALTANGITTVGMAEDRDKDLDGLDGVGEDGANKVRKAIAKVKSE